MPAVGLRRELETLKRRLAERVGLARTPQLERLRRDPALILADGLGVTPDPWQTTILRSSDDRLLMLCGRQVGKTTCAAALALKAALLEPPALCLVFSASQRQATELLRAVVAMHHGLGDPVPLAGTRDSVLKLELLNGSRVLSLPAQHATVRGFASARVVIVDEACLTPDALAFSVKPSLLVSRGRFVALSTPWARNWFYREWERGAGWRKVRVRSADCGRLDPARLAEDRAVMGELWARREFDAEWVATPDCVFLEEQVRAAFTDDRPLFPACRHAGGQGAPP